MLPDFISFFFFFKEMLKWVVITLGTKRRRIGEARNREMPIYITEEDNPQRQRLSLKKKKKERKQRIMTKEVFSVQE